MRFIIHKVCAYPMVLSWIIGTLLIWIPLSRVFAANGVFAAIPKDFSISLLLVVIYVVTSGLGFFVGAVLVIWFVFPVCRRVNGAPHEKGERVLILTGKHSGTSTSIYEISKGQGGQPVLRVDLGDEVKEMFGDFYEEESLLRLSPRSHQSEPNQKIKTGEQDVPPKSDRAGG